MRRASAVFTAATMLTGVGLAGAGATPAWAQATTTTPPEARDAANPQTGGDTVGDIVVTAQRRTERLQEVPITVTALDGDQLKRNNVVDIGRIEMVSPSFTFGRTGQDARPSIRGVITENPTAAADPTIGFYVDGVYQSRIQQASMPLVDVARVEVQMGPQGTLYGRNTYGGNISITNNTPGKELAAGLATEFGSLTAPRVEGFVNVPLSDAVQLRVAGLYSERKGYVTSVNNPQVSLGGADNVFVRATLRFAPDDRFEALLTGGYWHEYGQGGGSGYKILGTLVNPASGRRSIRGAPFDINPTLLDGVPDLNGFDLGVPNIGKGKYRNDWDYVALEDTEDRYGTLNLSYDLGVATVRSITGYTSFKSDRSADNDQTAIIFPRAGITGAGFPASGHQLIAADVRSLSQELQLASNSTRPLQWIVGAYYLNDSVDETIFTFRTAPTSVGANTATRQKVSLDSYAAFAQGSYFVLPDRLRLTAGVRYSYETKGFLIQNSVIPQTAGVISGPQTVTATTRGRPDFDAWTYRAGADLFVTPANMLYGSISTGYLSGGFNNNLANALIPPTYDPQRITAYEIGSKNTFLNDRVQLNVSLFDNELSDVQLQIYNQLANLAYTAAAGKARSRGAEVTAVVVPASGLRLSAGLGLLDAKYTRYLRPNPFAATPGDPALLDLAGNRIPLSPRWKTTSSIQYDFDGGSAGVFTPLVSWTHTDDYYTTDFNTVLDRQRSFDKVDASLAWSPPGSTFSLRGYVLNLTDVGVIQRSVYGSNQRLQVGYSAPREYGLTATARF